MRTLIRKFVSVLARLLRRLRAGGQAWDRSIGHIDSYDGRYIRGWFIARYPDAAAHRFGLTVNRRSLGWHEANQARRDLQAAHGVTECGFTLDLAGLGPDLSPKDQQRVRIVLRSEHGRRVVQRDIRWGRPDAPVSFAADNAASRLLRRLGGSSIRGWLDDVHAGGCSGWAVNQDYPGDPVPLALFVGGQEAWRFQTWEPRDGLDRVGVCGERAGFRLSWPLNLFAAGADVEVRDTVHGQSLAGGPFCLPTVAPIVEYAESVDAWRAGDMRAVTVIVPIYNAYEALVESLDALACHLPACAQVLLVDDASTDPRIGPLIRDRAKQCGWSWLGNAENQGYTRTINAAIASCPNHDVVLLNSDTVVTGRWLDNLRFCAYAKPRIATVTALSDNAGAFSIPVTSGPESEADTLLPDVLARVVTTSTPGRFLDVPTGNGFCMFVRRAVLDELGGFDERAFPRGYGEENEFCMRALRAGWTHRVSDKALVLHKRAQSFQGEREALLLAGSEKVHARYPEYALLTKRFQDIEFTAMRRGISNALRDPGSFVLPTILFVISTQSGGTPQTNLDLMVALKGRYRCLLLVSDAQTLTLSEHANGGLRELERVVLPARIDPVTHRSAAYDRIVSTWMYRYAVELLHVRHFAWHGLGLVEAAKCQGIAVVVSLHDFYTLCPSLKLLDENHRHCAGHCTAGSGSCQIELWPRESLPALKDQFVHRWRDMFREVFVRCDRFVTTAESAASTFLGIYPECRSRLSIIPHGRDFPSMRRPATRLSRGERARILVPGHLAVAKGAALIRDLARLDAGRRLELHFLGETWPGLHGVGVQHGAFLRQDVDRHVASIRPHLGLVFSIWPETWCHTLTEMWASGVPVAGIDLGAVGERIRASGAGWLVPPDASAEQIYARLLALLEDEAKFAQGLEALAAWQAGEGRSNDARRMAQGYDALYGGLLSTAGRSLATARPQRSSER